MTAIIRTVVVRLDPVAAFEVFTGEIDTWFPRGPHSFNYPDRATGIALEPGVGGRWREVWRDGDGYDIGEVLAWEPGRRLLLTYRHRHLPDDPLTEIEVRFEAVPGGTRVTLEHRGWERLPAEALREWSGRAWRALVAAYAAYAGPAYTTEEDTDMTTTEPDRAVEQQAVTPFLCYEDGTAAMDWLAGSFGFVERTRWLDEQGRLSHGEMLTGPGPGAGLIMMAGAVPGYESPRRHREHCAATAAAHEVPYVINGVLVRVDDVDAHHARARAAGARILSGPEGKPYGRSYRAEDLEGHRWMFLQDAVG